MDSARVRRGVARFLAGALFAGGIVVVNSPAVHAEMAASRTPSKVAAASGEPVEVTAGRTGYAQAFAYPDGTNALKQATTDPGVPTDVGVVPGAAGGDSTGFCEPAGAPLAVAESQPTVRARVGTAVSPGTHDGKGQLKVNYRIARKLDTGAWQEIWADVSPGSGYVPDGTLLDKQTAELTDGIQYRYRARTQSHWSDKGDSGEMYSAFSPWCYFTIDSSAPQAPTIQPKDPVNGSPYVECVTGSCAPKGGPGVAGSFVFTPNSADTDITAYQWTLHGPSGQVGAAHTVAAKADHTAEIANVIPSTGGSHYVEVWAIDVRARLGTPRTFDFQVSLPSGPVGRWHFDDAAPGSGETVARDSSAEDPQHDPSAPAHDLTLRGGSGFSAMARRGEQDASLWLDSGDPAQQQAYADASAPVVDTAHSFTVSAWVNLTDASSSRMIVTAPGRQAQAFALYYSSASRAYVFHYAATDSATPAVVRSVASTVDPPLGVWTHLAGVYTAATDANGNRAPQDDTIQLFVNGRAQGDPVNLSAAAPSYVPWAAGEGLQVGRSIVRGVAGQYFRGLIDEVAVWQSALSAEEVVAEATTREAHADAPAVELVADWNAEGSSGTAVDEFSPYPIGAMTLSSGGASLDPDSNTLVLDGGYASVTGPVIDETGSFTVSARAQINADVLNAKPDGYEAQVAGRQGSGGASWALAVQKLAADVYVWKFLRTTPSGSGVVTADVTDLSGPADTSSPVTLTGVYDAQEQGGRMHLYVGAQPVEDGPNNAATEPQQGTGSLAMGGTSDSDRFAGRLSRLRIWAGAMTFQQVITRVIAED